MSDIGKPSVATRFYLSTYLLQAAYRSQKQSDEAEEPFRGDPAPIKGRPPQEVQQALFEHSSHVLSSILSAVAFLEALVNELFLDAANEHPAGPAQQLPVGATTRFADVWMPESNRLKPARSVRSCTALDDERKAAVGEIRRSNDSEILQKYRIAPILAGKQQTAPGDASYHSITVLIELRNKVVHFKPETRSAASTDAFEERLLSERFRLHPRYENSPGNPVFPDKCLSHGCAEWAFSGSLMFADAFCERMEIEPNYHYFRPA